METNNVNPHTLRKFCIIALLSLLLSPSILAQANTRYAKQAIMQDINCLLTDIEAIHPDPFHSIERTDFLKRVEDIRRELPDSISKIDAWKISYEILSLLKEGHTYVLPPFKELGDFPRFPFTISIDKTSNTFIVTGALNENLDAPVGKRIIAINGVSTDSLLSIFRRSTSAENEALFIYMNEAHFDISLYAIFGAPAYFDIIFLDGDKVEKGSYKSSMLIPGGKEPNYSFSIIRDSIGMIDMNRLNAYGDFKKFCRSTFKTLKKKQISNIIIDFRGNGGGDSQIGDELIRYLSNTPFIQYQKAAARVSAASREVQHYPFEQDTILEIDLAGSAENMIEPYPEKLRFQGSVYVLIDGGTFSSAGSTVWCIDHYDLATTIGSETGGAGVHYGYPMERELPNTGLQYFISHMKWYQIGADETSYHGLFPDYPIALSIEDIVTKRDAALEFTLELIRREE